MSPAAKYMLSLFDGGTKLTRAACIEATVGRYKIFEIREAFAHLANSKQIVRADRDVRPRVYCAVQYRTTKRGPKTHRDLVQIAKDTQPNSVFALAKML